MEKRSHIESVDERATELRQAYVDNFSRNQALDSEYTSNKDQIAQIGREIITTSGLFSRSKLQRRSNKLYSRQGKIIQSRLETNLGLGQDSMKSAQHYQDNKETYFEAALIDAAKAGISINTQDPLALKKAIWKKDNVTEGQTPLSLVETFNLDDITAEELESNLQAYPEMSWQFDETTLKAAKNKIASIPLTHFTEEPSILVADENEIKTLVLFSHRSLHQKGLIRKEFDGEGIKGFSYDVDQALGLDRFVFMCLGAPYPNQHENTKSGILILDASILLDENCLITPSDISLHCPDVYNAGTVESSEGINALQSFRSSVVSGKGWLEILARRVAKHSEESPNIPFPIKDCFTLGEVKYRGAVPGQAITGILRTRQDMMAYVQSLAKTGFELPNNYTDNFYLDGSTNC